MRTRPTVLAVAVLGTLLAGCTHKAKPPAPDPDAEGRALRGRLAVLAQATANGVYDATYKFVQLPSRTAGEIRIRQRPPQYRIDVVTKDTASFFSLTTGTVSCSQRRTKEKACFLVAKPGEEVPALFDPGVQRLFRDAVADLAANPNDYLVTVPPPETVPPTSPVTPTAPLTLTPSTGPPSVAPPPTPLPGGECFVVSRTATTASPDLSGFEDGTYCFAERGVATRIEVASGTLTLLRVGPEPDAAAFQPIATVRKLPDLTPTPTPKK